MKSKFTLVISLVLVISVTSPAISKGISISSVNGISITEGDSLQTSLTQITGHSSDLHHFGIYCDGLEDTDCVSKQLSIKAFLLPCSEKSTLACIKEVYAKDRDGKKILAKYERSVASNLATDVEEIQSRGVVAGSGTGGVWEFPGIVHGAGTTLYGVQAKLEGWGYGSGINYQTKFSYNRIEFGISAIKQVAGNFKPNAIEIKSGTLDKQITGWDTIGSNGRPDYKCVMTETNICYERANFPVGYRFGMVITLPNPLAGWFHGRIYSPEIVVTRNLEGGGFDYLIEANPVKVPYLREDSRADSWTKDLADYVESECAKECSNGGGYLMPGNSGVQAFGMTSRFLPVLKDKATGIGDYWSVRTLDMWNGTSDKVQSCSASGSSVSGIVTTNAMVYSAGPPDYNPENSSLDYKVLSPHYDDKLVENIGSYDLLLRSDVARCIYGFSDAPIKAEIEIVGSDGKSKVATTLIGEKAGWLFMSANGFSFSEPTVRVTLKQDPVPVATPTPTPSPTASATPTPTPTPSPVVTQAATSAKVTQSSKKTTITCSKSGKIKKVTAIKPKCPTGFKKV